MERGVLVRGVHGKNRHSYLGLVERTMLNLFLRGLFFDGMDSHVFLPITTAFCLATGNVRFYQKKRLLQLLKYRGKGKSQHANYQPI